MYGEPVSISEGEEWVLGRGPLTKIQLSTVSRKTVKLRMVPDGRDHLLETTAIKDMFVQRLGDPGATKLSSGFTVYLEKGDLFHLHLQDGQLHFGYRFTVASGRSRLADVQPELADKSTAHPLQSTPASAMQ
ncbi:hypothetical protein CYMTET_24298, partial [Cymbomonas tetramitiformis]